MKRNKGTLEIITGCMFSGKTEELLSIVKKLEHDNKRFLILKPNIDYRYLECDIVSHLGNKAEATIVDIDNDRIIVTDNPKIKIVIIDEIQFFNDCFLKNIETFINKGIDVIAAGLSTDFRGEPFSIVSTLLAKADKIKKLNAICVKCGNSATMTQRIINNIPAKYNDPIILIGGQEKYEARCKNCHEIKKD